MPKSAAWDFFIVDKNNERYAVCNKCQGKISRGVNRKNFSTTPMRVHLKSCHPLEYQSLLKKEEGMAHVCVHVSVCMLEFKREREREGERGREGERYCLTDSLFIILLSNPA